MQSKNDPPASNQPSGESLHTSPVNETTVGDGDGRTTLSEEESKTVGGKVGNSDVSEEEIISPPPHTQQAILAVFSKKAY